MQFDAEKCNQLIGFGRYACGLESFAEVRNCFFLVVLRVTVVCTTIFIPRGCALEC